VSKDGHSLTIVVVGLLGSKRGPPTTALAVSFQVSSILWRAENAIPPSLPPPPPLFFLLLLFYLLFLLLPNVSLYCVIKKKQARYQKGLC
jgi:hypothetical protein